MSELERLAEEAREEAREDIQKRRIQRYVVDTYTHVNSLILARIWEKLSEDGWHEEIAAHKSMYEQGLLRIKGVMVLRPLGEKGTHILNL
jgi:hypothetical protein